MHNNFPSGRLNKVLVIDEDETDVYIAKRIISSASFADQIAACTCVHDAMSYLRENIKDGDMPQLIFLGLNAANQSCIDFLYEYSEFSKMTGKKCDIALLVNSIGMLRNFMTKHKIHPHVKFVFEKPLTVESLCAIV